MIHYADYLEESVGQALEAAGITFIHESQNKSQILDFYLPNHEVYIEVKQYHSPRAISQLSKKDEVILLQGKKAINFFNTKLYECGA